MSAMDLHTSDKHRDHSHLLDLSIRIASHDQLSHKDWDCALRSFEAKIIEGSPLPPLTSPDKALSQSLNLRSQYYERLHTIVGLHQPHHGGVGHVCSNGGFSCGMASMFRGRLKIHQRGMQWKQGAVICMMLYTSLLYNTTSIRCTPLRLHPPVMNANYC